MRGGTALGLLLMFFGYSVTYYGLTQLQGGNWGYMDLVLPSRWPAKAGVARDAPQTHKQATTQNTLWKDLFTPIWAQKNPFG